MNDKIVTFNEDGSKKSVTYLDADGNKMCEFLYYDDGSCLYQLYHRNGKLWTSLKFDNNGRGSLHQEWDETGKLINEIKY